MIIFKIYLLSGVIISTRTTSQEVSITRQGVQRKNCAATFYAIPGFVAVLKIPVI